MYFWCLNSLVSIFCSQYSVFLATSSCVSLPKVSWLVFERPADNPQCWLCGHLTLAVLGAEYTGLCHTVVVAVYCTVLLWICWSLLCSVVPQLSCALLYCGSTLLWLYYVVTLLALALFCCGFTLLWLYSREVWSRVAWVGALLTCALSTELKSVVVCWFWDKASDFNVFWVSSEGN